GYYELWAQDALADARLAQEEMGEYFMPFNSNSNYYIQRADDRILSIREDFDEYYGGVHGMYGTIGYVFDTKTGKQLTLGDVLLETDSISALLAEKLEAKYAEELEGFHDSILETMKGYALEDYKWTLDYEGITFYFDPYELASYAAGLLTITLPYGEYPELFPAELTEQPKNGYIKGVPLWNTMELDLNPADEKTDTVSVIAASIGEYGEKQIEITRNEAHYVDEESFGYRFASFLMYQEGGYYLVVKGVAENEYPTLYVYDLNGETIRRIGCYEGTGFPYPDMETEDEQYGLHEVIHDPAQLTLSTVVYALGTMDGRREYHFEKGILAAEESYYTLPDYVPPLISKVELEVPLQGEEGTAVLPAGTAYYFKATDNETYVDMDLEDGRTVRLELGEGEWCYTINGMSEYDVFEELFYAG
ncbi:MAG: DUF3298 domain-containing protein, partial [Bacillota bacterium]|nr:DUF3298 domain-containing protein [Bacillota bacterium]